MTAPFAILVVDSDPPSLASVVDLLNSAKHEATGVSSFEAARRLLTTARFDLVITSIRLGAFNGLHLVAHCQAFSPATRAIVFSDSPDHISAHEARLLGAQYVARPAPARLLSLVSQTFGSAEGELRSR